MGREVFPQIVERLPIGGVAGFEIVVGRATARVHGADRVALELGARSEGDAAVHVDDLVFLQRNARVTLENVSGKIEILAVASGAVELDERPLYLGVSGHD